MQNLNTPNRLYHLESASYLLKPFRFEDIESALLSCIHSLDNLESRRRQQTYIQEKLQLISPLLTEQIYQDLLEGRIGDYSEK